MVDKIGDPEAISGATEEGVERLDLLNKDVALIIANIQIMLEEAKRQGVSVDKGLLGIEEAEQLLSELGLRLLRISGALYQEGVRLPVKK